MNDLARAPAAALTYGLLAANVAVFALESVYGDAVITAFALWPLGHGFQPWQPGTSAFLHAGIAHLATNMFGLWMFGRDVERTLGTRRFATLYLASLVTAAIAQLAVSGLMAEARPSLGASGALFGVLAAFAMLFPTRRVVLLFPPIPMKARTFMLAYAAFELYAGVTGTFAGVAHFAHLGGLVGGVLCVRYWLQPGRNRPA